MIDDALDFLKTRLNAYLLAGRSPGETQPELAAFVPGDKIEPINFPVGTVSLILINLEEETTLRPPDLYRRATPYGDQQNVQPEIRLNLFVLFVARFADYKQSLHYLSLVIQYFQNHRVFDSDNSPELSDTIGQLVMELRTLPFAEQNEVWNALRTTYQPSALYKVKMVVFQDADAFSGPPIQAMEIQVSP
jgi:hypothetical protein